MKSITDLLGLPESADEPAILDAIQALKDALAAKTGIPKELKAVDVAAKMAAGLTKEQAIEVLLRQIDEDKAAAEEPETKKEKKGK